MKVIVEIEMNVDNATYRNPHNDSKVDEIAVITSIKESLKNAYMLVDLNKKIVDYCGNKVGSITAKIER